MIVCFLSFFIVALLLWIVWRSARLVLKDNIHRNMGVVFLLILGVYAFNTALMIFGR